VNVNPSAVDVVAENVGVGASGGSVTVKANVADEEPPVFVAVIVYVVATRVAVGVPLIRPVEVEKLNPAASVEGLIEYDVGVPPVFEMEYKPLTALSTFAVAEDRDSDIEGASTRVTITMVRPTDVNGVVDG
jgi:hypothetical protein